MSNKIIKHYRNILVNNAYIDLEVVANFLENACISDILVIAELLGKNKGMSKMDYDAIQEAVNDARSWGVAKEEFYQLRYDDEKFAEQWEDTDEAFEEWFDDVYSA